MNCDFSRKTGHVNAVQSFVVEYSLIKTWDDFTVDFTYSQEIQENLMTSTIDHFFWNESLSNQILDAGVVHSIDNSSDHSPVYCVIKVEHNKVADTPGVARASRPNWRAASTVEKEAFKQALSDNLYELEIPDSIALCREVHCKNLEHQHALDEYMTSILNIVEVEAKKSLPVIKPKFERKRAPKSGWSEQVKPYRDTAHFWNQVWKSAGCPHNTVLYNIMKRSRNIYHYQHRKCSKSVEMIRKNKILDSCINGDGDIFEEIKAMRKHSKVTASCMDGVTEDIPGHFKGIYEKLYNSHDDHANIVEIDAEVNSKINYFHLVDVDRVTPDIVKKAASRLHSNKSDPIYTFSSDCIQGGPDLLYQHLSVALKSFLIHGHVTLFLLIATLIPLIKDKLGNVNSSKNYRSIALSSLILKLFDWVILLLYGHSLGLDQLQFAYQPGASTTMCTWTAVETISYFTRNGSEVFSCLMDMTKAFDLVRHSIMFKKIMSGGLSLIFVRLIIFIYVNQSANVRWNSIFSSSFFMKNGIRQGAVLSAIFYCIYMNNLFEILRGSKYGCWIHGEYYGILGYSDDNLLLAPSIYALQEMLKICEEYAALHDLKFSTEANPRKCKTKCITFLNRRRELPDLKLSGNSLPWVASGKHLGVTLDEKNDGLKYDMMRKRAQYISKNNEILQEFRFCKK